MNVCKGRLLKKSSNRKSKLALSTLVAIWLSNITFHLRSILLQTLVSIDSESRLTLFPYRRFHRNFHSTRKKKVTCRGTRAVSRPEIYKALKPCWLLNWVSIVRCSMFSSSEPVAVSSYCCRLGNALCLCSPVRPAQAEPESGPKSLAIDFAL